MDVLVWGVCVEVLVDLECFFLVDLEVFVCVGEGGVEVDFVCYVVFVGGDVVEWICVWIDWVFGVMC